MLTFFLYSFPCPCSVLRINYDTSQRKISKVEDALRNMQERVSCEISDGQLMQAHGSTEAIRKITAFNNLARILEQTADKVRIGELSLSITAVLASAKHLHYLAFVLLLLMFRVLCRCFP